MSKQKKFRIPNVVWTALMGLMFIIAGVCGYFLGVYIGIRIIRDFAATVCLGVILGLLGLVLSTALQLWLEYMFEEYIDL